MPQARQRFPLGLRFRLGLVVVIALAPVFALVGISAHAVHEHDAEQAAETAIQVADFLAGHWRDTAAAAQQTVLALSLASELRQVDPSACQTLLPGMRMRMLPAYDNMSLTDNHGNVLCSAHPYQPPLDVSDRIWYQRAIMQASDADPEAVIGEYLVSRITGRQVLIVATPLRADDGSIERLLTISIDLTNLSDLPGLHLPPGAVAMYVNADLTTLARHPQGEGWIGRTVRDDALVQQVLAHLTGATQEARFLSEPADGQRAYVGARLVEVGGARMYVIVALDYATVHARTQRLMRLVLSALAVMLLATVAAALIIGEWGILRPIIALEWATRQIAAGDLTARASVRGASTEVSAVGRALNAMAAALQQRLAERDDALRALRHERDLVGRLADTSPTGMVVLDAEGRITFANPEAEHILGLTHDEIIQRTYNALAWRITTYEGSPFPDAQLPFAQVQSTGQPVHGVRYAIVRPDGQRICLQINGAPLTDETGGFAGMVSSIEDITPWIRAQEESQRINRALRLLTDCNQVLVRSEAEDKLLHDICHTLVERGGYRLAWVGYPQDDAQRSVRPVAYAGIAQEALAEAGIVWADEVRGQGPTGVAIRTRQAAQTRYVTVEPQFEPWRHLIAKYGLVSGMSLPLIVDGSLLGALTLYSDDPEAFDATEGILLRELANDLTFGIQGVRARAAQRAAEAEAAQLARFPSEDPNPVLRLGIDGSVLYANSAGGRFLAEAGIAPGGPLPGNWAAAIQRDITANRANSYELTLGDRVWAATVAPISQHQDVNVYARDITLLARAQEAVRRNGEAQAIVNRLLTASLTDAPLGQIAQQALDGIIALPWLPLLPKGYLYLRTNEHNYELAASVGIIDMSREAACANCGAETCACLFERRPQYIDHAGHTEGERRVREPHVHYCHPILSGDEVVGTLSLYLKAHVRLDAQAEGVLDAIARALAATRAHKLSEQALNQEQALVRALQEGIPDLIYFRDADLRYLRINRALAQLYGLADPALALGKSDADLGSPLSSPSALAEERQVLATGETMANREERLVWPDGRESWLSVTRAPLRDASGAIVGVYAIARDITERRLLEQRVFQVQKMDAIGRLASGVAHDFNGILTVINGYTDLILSSLEPGDPLLPDLEEVAQAGKRGEALARQLLALGRRSALQPRALDLSEVVRGVQPMLSRIVREELRLKVQLADDLDSVHADPGQIEQVLVNLVSNARDAIAQTGEIVIETANVELNASPAELHGDTCHGPHVMLAVSDTGSGFSSEILAHLFEPFYTTKEPGRGTGLGLSVVYGIARQNGGCVQVVSKPGQGTRVAVYLPRVTAAAQGLTAAERPAIPRGSETILVVEDQEQVRAVIVRMLQDLGYRVLQASSGPEALVIFEHEQARIALVLTDVVMPDMRGTELARRLRARAPQTCILFVSGYTDLGAEEHEAFDQTGGVLHKPFAADALAHRLRQALDART